MQGYDSRGTVEQIRADQHLVELLIGHIEDNKKPAEHYLKFLLDLLKFRRDLNKELLKIGVKNE